MHRMQRHRPRLATGGVVMAEQHNERCCAPEQFGGRIHPDCPGVDAPALSGAEWRKAARKAAADQARARRNQRGHRPPPGITGIRAATRGGHMSEQETEAVEPEAEATEPETDSGEEAQADDAE